MAAGWSRVSDPDKSELGKSTLIKVCLVLVGQGIELDAVGRQFATLVITAAAPLKTGWAAANDKDLFEW